MRQLYRPEAQTVQFQSRLCDIKSPVFPAEKQRAIISMLLLFAGRV